MSSNERPYITCHVLDTVAGKPGANISVTLRLIGTTDSRADQYYWTARTNSDGRVPAWTAGPDAPSVNDIIKIAKERWSQEELQAMSWSLKFDTESYFGKGKTFWPEVELKFTTNLEEEHYHVPLLLGPWSYTTYRGS